MIDFEYSTVNWIFFIHEYFFLKGNVGEAHELMKDIDPSQPNEYILKGVVNAAVGQDQGSVSPSY